MMPAVHLDNSSVGSQALEVDKSIKAILDELVNPDPAQLISLVESLPAKDQVSRYKNLIQTCIMHGDMSNAEIFYSKLPEDTYWDMSYGNNIKLPYTSTLNYSLNNFRFNQSPTAEFAYKWCTILNGFQDRGQQGIKATYAKLLSFAACNGYEHAIIQALQEHNIFSKHDLLSILEQAKELELTDPLSLFTAAKSLEDYQPYVELYKHLADKYNLPEAVSALAALKPLPPSAPAVIGLDPVSNSYLTTAYNMLRNHRSELLMFAAGAISAAAVLSRRRP